MTKEQREHEIERLAEWVSDMEYMLSEDGTVPANMRGTYERSLASGRSRLMELEMGIV